MKIKKLSFYLGVVAIISLSACNTTPDSSKVELKTHMDSISYIVGLDHGVGLNRQGVDYNPLAVFKGIEHAKSGQDIIPDSLKIKLIEEVNMEIQLKAEDEFKNLLVENKKKGNDFLRENMKQSDVVSLPSGLQYKIVNKGATNIAKPKVTDSVIVHYRAALLDGTVVDETYGRQPASFRLNNVLQGLSDGIQLMNPGAIYEFFVPSNMAFGDQHFIDENGNIIIPAGSLIIYRVELINIAK